MAKLTVSHSLTRAFSYLLVATIASSFKLAQATASDAIWQQVLEEAIRSNSSISNVAYRAKFIHFPSKRPVCADPTVTLPQRLIGTIYVQLRCPSMKWTGQAQVLVETKRNFIALTKSLQVGSVIEEGDVAIYESDWGSGFEQAFDNVDQVVGKTLTRSLVAGAPLTLNSIRQTSVIRSGDRVRVLMVGKNFSVSGEGVAMSSAAAGDQVKVRMGSGQSVSGLAVRAGVVQIIIE